MLQRRFSLVALTLVGLLCLAYASPMAEGNANSKYNQTSGCTCHYSGGGVTASISGLPAQYTPGQAYSITVSGSGGPSGSGGGFSMDVDRGTFSNAGSNAQVNGASATHSGSGARSWTMTWTAPSAGAGTATFSLAVLMANSNYQNSGDSWTTTSVQVPEMPAANNAPTASNLALTPDPPNKATGVTLTYNYADADGDAESGTSIQWFRDGNLVAGQDDRTHVVGGHFTRGEQWHAEVTPSDGTDDGTTVISPYVTIGNAAPTVSQVILSPANPMETDSLSAAYLYDDLDGDTESGTIIHWYLDGARVSELDGATAVSSLMTRPGDVWQFRVTPSDGADSGVEVASDLVTIGSSNSAPVLSQASIDAGEGHTGEDLVASYQFADADGDAQGEYDLHWSVDDVRVTEHDDQLTIPASATTKGEVWTFRVRASDGAAWSDWAHADGVTIQNSLPVQSDAVLGPESPTTIDALSISYDYADADGDAESGSIIQWYRDGLLQSGLNGQTQVDAGETARGEVWSVRLGVSDGEDTLQAIEVAQVTIGNALPSADEITFTGHDGSYISTHNITVEITASDADGDLLTSNIRWLRDGFHVPALDGATSVAPLHLAPGQTWMVEVDMDDGMGTGQTAYSDPILIENLLPTAAFATPDNPMEHATYTLSGAASDDADGEIVAWFWNIDGEAAVGEEITFTMPGIAFSVNLTVLDEHGGMASVVHMIQPAPGPVVEGLAVEAKDGEVQLDWTWSGEATEFTVWRTDAVPTAAALADMTAVATTNATSWSEPVHVVGEHTYLVTVDIDGVHNPRLDGPNTATVTLAAGDAIATESAATSGGAAIAMFVLFLLGTIGAISTALLDRMSRRDA